ncbi:conserved protein of unknown function [Tenacibaculum sp. 190524A02b]|uniref:phage tail tape measure protein n=1 Tax=Tenacibaculum vairaonense TaxID=3137860 RepID=UPI0032B1D66A
MAKTNKLSEKSFVDQSAYEFAQKWAKSLEPGIKAGEELNKILLKMSDSYSVIKKQTLEFSKLEKAFKVAPSRKDFLELKKEETELLKKNKEAHAKLFELEQNLLVLVNQKNKINSKDINLSKKSIDLKKKTSKELEQLNLKRKNSLKIVRDLLKKKEEGNKLSKEEQKLLNKNIGQIEKLDQSLQKYKVDKQRLNKIEKENAKLLSTLTTAYEKQVIVLNRLKRQYKDVAIREGETSKRAIELRNQIVKLDTTLKRVDANVGEFQRNVGNYGKAMASAANAARNMASALGFTGGIFLFVQTMREANDIVRSFGKTMSNIAGIYRTNRDSLASLEAKIISVAGASVNTATEVASLAESLATLGKTDKEIETLLAPVNDLSIGLNAASDEAGEFLVQMLNTFGASSNEAGKYADIIATIRTSTSLDFQKMRDSFQYLAPISKALNKDIAYTGSLIGILADNGIKAERAGRLLGTAQQGLAKVGKTLTDALDALNVAKKANVSELDLLKLASELFGKQAAALGVVLADNTELIDVNAQAIRENSGALNDLVKEQLQSLDAHFKMLESRWEQYILNADKASGASNDLKKILKFLADNLDKVINSVLIAVKWFGIYKAITFSTNIAVNLASKANGLYKLSLVAMNGGIKKVITSLKAMKVATATSGLGFLIVALGSIYELYQSFKDGANEAAAAQMTLNEAIAAGAKNIDNYISKLKSIIGLELDQVKEDEKNKLSLAKTEKEKIAIKKQSLNEQLKIIRDKTELFKKEIELREKEKEHVLKERKDEIGASYIQGEIDERKKYLKYLKRQENEILRNYRKSSKEKKDIDEKRRKQLAKDKFEYEKYQLESTIKFEQEIRDNQEETNYNRLKSNLYYVRKSIKLAELEAKEAIKNAKGRSHKVKEIQERLQEKVREIRQNGEDNAKKILKESFDKRKAFIEKEKNAEENHLQELITLENNKLKESLKQEGLSLKEREKLIEEHEKRVSKIKQDSAEKNLKNQISLLEQELKNESYTKEQKEQLAELLSSLKLALSDITTQGIIENLQKQKEKERAVQEYKTQQIQKASNVIADSLNLDASNIESFLTGVVDGFGKGTEGILNGVSSVASVIGDVMSSISQGNIEEINNQIQANDEYYEREIELAEGNETKQDELRKEKEQKRKELEKKRKKEQHKQAKYQRDAALFQIGINTAQAILGIWADVPKVDFGISAGLMTAFVGGLGLAQMAAVASRPLPKYAKGTDFHPGGFAEVGEERPEVIIEPNKAPYVVNKPTVLDLPKGTKVVPSLEEYQSLMNASVMTSLSIEKKKLNDYNEKKKELDNILLDQLVKETIKTRIATEKNKTNVYVEKQQPTDFEHEFFRLKNTDWDA